jgi:hypothetical protein
MIKPQHITYFHLMDINDIPDTAEGLLLVTAIGKLMLSYPFLTANQILKMLIDVRGKEEQGTTLEHEKRPPTV